MSRNYDDTEGSTARAPLFDETEDGQLISADAEESQRMAAIHAAVTDIIASESGADGDASRSWPSGESNVALQSRVTQRLSVASQIKTRGREGWYLQLLICRAWRLFRRSRLL